MIVPQDIQTEEILLSTLAQQGAEELTRSVIGELTIDCFTTKPTRDIFEAIRALDGMDHELGMLNILNKLKEVGSRVTTDALVEVMAKEEVTKPKILINKLKDIHARRQLIRLSHTLSQMANTETDSLEVALQTGIEAITEVQKGIAREETFSGIDLFRYIEEGIALSPGKGRAGCFGMAIDDDIEVPYGEPTLLGARPGCGKTALAIQFAMESVKRLDRKPLFISLELSKEKILARAAGYITNTSGSDWRHGHYEKHRDNVYNNQETIRKTEWWCPNQGTPWPVIEAVIRKACMRKNIDSVILDYFGYIGRPPVTKGSSEAYAFGRVMDGISGLAKNLGIGILLLSQLKQDQACNKPGEGSFADSDRPYRDANLALMMWKDKQDVTRMWNPKNRDGVPGKEWALDFKGATGRFTLQEHETNPEGVLPSGYTWEP